MKRLFLLLLSISVGPVFAVTFGTGPTPTCYSNSSYTIATSCQAMQGQTIYIVSPVAVTWSTYGHFTGTLTTIDSTHAKYVAPSTVTPIHVVGGLQTLPNDEIFFTKVDQLPAMSTHWLGDGSGYCEGFGGTHASDHCAGDPTQGTGIWALLEPAGFPNAGNSCCGATVPHVGASPSGRFIAEMSIQGSVLTGNEPKTWNISTAYTHPSRPTSYTFPDFRFDYGLHIEGGNYRLGQQDCSLDSSHDGPVPGYPNCPQSAGGGHAPYGRIGGDWHLFELDPVSTLTYELYNIEDIFGAKAACTGGSVCGANSGRQLDWMHYEGRSAMGLAGTPEVQLELTGEDLDRAALLGHDSINHGLVFTASGGSIAGNNVAWVWPALGPCFSCTVTSTATLMPMGGRFRLSPTRTSMDLPILTGFNVVNAGAGYTPGQVVHITITSGCSSIDGTNQAGGIAFIGTNGSIGNSGAYIYVTNTGHACNGPFTYSVDPPQAGGTPISVTAQVFSGPWGNVNVANALYDQRTKYGLSLDDIENGNDHHYRVDGDASTNPYIAVVGQFDGTGIINVNPTSPTTGKMFGNFYLYDEVDSSELLPPNSSGFGTSIDDSYAGQKAYWIADSGDPTEGASVSNQAMVKMTATSGGAISYMPIPLLGVGVASYIGDGYNLLNIVSGMPAYQIPIKVYGDPSNSGVTFSWAVLNGVTQDPCSGQDTLTSSGLYTPCPQYTATTYKTGMIKATSVANTNAFALIRVNVLPVDTSGNIRIDVGGNGASNVVGADGTTTWFGTYNSTVNGDMVFRGSGAYTKSGDYPGWLNFGKWGTTAAPLSTSGEHSIYETYTYGAYNDITVSIVVPNGNYRLRTMNGLPYNGASQQSTSPPNNRGYQYVQTGDNQITNWMWNELAPISNTRAQAVDLITPVKVTDNILRYRIGAMNPNRWGGHQCWSCNNTSLAPELHGLGIYKDITTAPYWEMGSYVPFRFFPGDQFQIDPTDAIGAAAGATPTALGYTGTGFLQLYVRDWFTGKNDPVWSLVSGPGSISSTGIYKAPTTIPSSNDCAVVQAQSASQPSLFVRHSVCIIPSMDEQKSSAVNPSPVISIR